MKIRKSSQSASSGVSAIRATLMALACVAGFQAEAQVEPPKIQSITAHALRYPDGTLLGEVETALTITGADPAKTYNIEGTTNLENWQVVTPSPLQADASGSIFWEDAEETSSFFYRLHETATPGNPLLSIINSPAIPPQYIGVNTPNQIIGGFQVIVVGQPVSVQSLTFDFAVLSGSLGGATYETLRNITLVNQNGPVVAGPYDPIAVDPSGDIQEVTFNDPVTFPVGTNTYSLFGMIPPSAQAGTVVEAFTDPSLDWLDVTGQTNGISVSLANIHPFSMSDMTVRVPSLVISVDSKLTSRTIVPGGEYFFAYYDLDASQSGDDIRIGSLPLVLNCTGLPSNLTDGVLWYSNAPLSLARVVNAQAGQNLFTFGNPFVVPKGTIVQLGLSFYVDSSTTNGSTYQWGITNIPLAITGNNSGVEAMVIVPTNNTGPIITVGAGSLVVTTDLQSPDYTVVGVGVGNGVGASDVILGAYRFQAGAEAVNLSRVGFQLSDPMLDSPSDLADISLWNGICEIGEATFTGPDTITTLDVPSVSPNGCPAGYATVPANGSLTLTVRGDLNAISVGGGVISGQLLTVNIFTDTNNDGVNTQGVGVESGKTYQASGSTAIAGVRIFGTVPEIALGTLPISGVTGDGKLIAFSITNPTDDNNLQLNQFAFSFAASAGINSITGVNLYDYTDAGYSQPANDALADGQLLVNNMTANTDGAPVVFTVGNPNGYIIVPANSTRYFVLKGTVTLTGSNTDNAVATTLLGDGTYPTLPAGQFRSTIAQLNGKNFIWSDGETSTPAATTAEAWTDSYGLPGFQASGLTQSRTQ